MINPKSLENLQRFDQMDTAQHKALSSKGGKASAQRRRELKEEKELFTALIKYGDALRVFARLVELPPKQFDKMIDQLKQNNHG